MHLNFPKNMRPGAVIVLLLSFITSIGFAQDIVDPGDHQFWSCGSDSLRQWRLTGNQVSGGLGINRDFQSSIAYCNNTQAVGTPATLFAADASGQGKVYNGSTWDNPGFFRVLLDIGGHENDLYSAGVTSFGAPATMLDYYDPSSGWSKIVTLPNNEVMTVQDVLVDELGRAWIFTGTTSAYAEHLRCYDRNGNLFADLPCDINTDGAYGALLMNDSIFIAKDATANFDANTLLPVRWNQNQTLLEQGVPIPFTTSNPKDLASSTPGNPAILLTSLQPEPEIELSFWPNPCRDQLFIDLTGLEKPAHLTISDLHGKTLISRQVLPGNVVRCDLSSYPKGVYSLQLSGTEGQTVRKIIHQ